VNLGPVKETATTEDSESLLKIKASVYHDFFFVERENRLEKRNGRSRKLYLRIASSVHLQLLLVSNVFSVAGHILGIRRTRLSNENYESMLFAKVNFDLYDAQHVADNKRLKL